MEGGITSFDVLMVTDGDEHERVGIFELSASKEWNQIKKSTNSHFAWEQCGNVDVVWYDDDAVVYFGPLLWPTTGTQWPLPYIHSLDKCLSTTKKT